ncbi:MAG TPA: CopD family protein [Steroidobacteraceae bacterium]|jgi:putative copper export protein
MIDGLWLAARAGSYLLVLQATGTLIFLALFGRHFGGAAGAAGAVARMARRCALGALCVCTLQLLLEPAYMAGEAAGIMDSGLQHLVLHSRSTLATALRAAAMICVILASARTPPRAVPGIAAVCLTLASFVVIGHTVTAIHRALLAPLLGWHVLAVSFWLGALWPLHLLARSLGPLPLAALLERFSALALKVVPLLGLAGLAMACLLLPDLGALGTRYGVLLCTKTALFAGLMGLAALNRTRLTPALAQGNPAAARVLRRSLIAEYALISAVLLATAALTGLYSPDGH